MTCSRIKWAPVVLLFVPALVTSEFSIDVYKTGDYNVKVNGALWLSSGATSFQSDGQHHTTADGTLRMASNPSFDSGTDILGSWKSVVYSWDMGSTKTVNTTVTKYKNFALFKQNFVEGLDETSVGNKNSVISGFPSFQVGRSDAELGMLAFSGLFIGWMQLNESSIGRWTNFSSPKDGLDSGPLVLFDGKGKVVIISAFSQFMAASYAHDTKSNILKWGIMGDVNSVPAGYEYSTIVFYSDQGINKAIKEWGFTLRSWYKRSTASREQDPSINYIGYYTDNGAYYYHHTEPGINYEKSMAKVVSYVKSKKVPYRYIQLDDWWYPIKGPGYGATISWTANHTVFPHGLQYVYNMTGWPVVGHNRYWSNITTYAKQNGGKFDFLKDGKLSLPDDQSFWDDLFRTAKEWGLIVYEQDWLNYQVENIGPLHTDLTLGRRWLHQMGEAAARNDLQIQYCMAQPRHLLASLEVPAVSQIRASLDYHLSDIQWQIGITSMLADALGVAPFKDNFWTVSEQPGNIYNATEPNPLLQAAVSLFSTGPVGVGDRAGYTNTSIINRLINAEGLLLKPSNAATVIDSQIYRRALGIDGPDGELWTTLSVISGVHHGIIFCPLLKGPYTMGPTEAGFPNAMPYVVYSYKFDCAKDYPVPFSKDKPLMLQGCQPGDFCLYYASHVINWRNKSLVILGEMAKLVPVSPQRVTAIEYSSSDFTITIKGMIGEHVDFFINYDDKNILFNCEIGATGTARIRVASNVCH